MSQKPIFNPSLRMPIIDIIVAVVLIVVTGYFWYNTTGVQKLEDAYEDLRESRASNQAELEESQASLAEAEQELIDTQNDRDAKMQYVEFLNQRIASEEQTIADAVDEDARFTDEMLDLRTEIQRGKDERLAFNSDILETQGRIAEEEAVVANLELQAQDRNARIGALETWIAAAERQLEEDPPSLFPEESALASVVEITDQDPNVLVSLSRNLKTVGVLDVGLLGSLGMRTDGEASTKEGGVYANMPLVPKRASIDFEGGISQIESRKEDKSDTGAFAGASLRFQPNPKERLFLVAGTRVSHEDLALRLGLALGRK